MAINYATLFGRLGKLIKWANKWLTLQGTVDAAAILYAADEILDQFDAAGAERRDLVTGLQDQFQGFSSSVESWMGSLTGFADRVLVDLQLDLNAPTTDVTTLLRLLSRDMIANAQTINANVVGAPVVTAGGSNAGNGQLIVSKVNIDAVDDERIIAQSVKLVCGTDQFSGGIAGGESFSLTGYPQNSATSYKTRGNGTGSSLSVADESGNNRLANGNFDSFGTTNTPDSWTIDVGVVGTTIFEEAVIVHNEEGGKSLKLQSDATATTITLSQNIKSLVTPRERYAIAAWVRKNGAFGGGVTNLQISVKGTGFATVNLFNADPTTLTTSFVFKKGGSDGFFTVPADIPDDLKVEITWTAANLATAGAQIVIDDFALVKAVEFGHLFYALFRGSADFIAGDVFTVATTNTYEGVIQTFFGRFYDTQLPSNAAGGETLLDSLAT